VSQYLEDVSAALRHDSSRLGHVWRHRDKTPKEIATEADVPTPGFVYNMRAVIAAIVDNQLPQSPSVARHVRDGIRGLIRRDDGRHLSEGTIQTLEERATACDKATSDPDKVQREQRVQGRQTAEAEGKDIPGIYVYSYPHYLSHPVLPGETHEGTRSSSSARTYVKIGKSGRNVAERLTNQMRGTSVPEEPVLLRIYRCDEGTLGDVEKRLHEHLRAADHGRTRMKGTGKEWFLTHLDLVDSAARLMGLEIAYDHEAPSSP